MAAQEAPAPEMTEAEYYARQMCLAEVGPQGQEKLRSARVLIVGAGGLGSPALAYLAAAGIGTLGICEADQLEASNLHRQVLYAHDTVGRPKAELARERLQAQNPFVQVQVHAEGLTPENVLALFADYDLVLDCTDNFSAKFMINDAAVLTGTPAIFASIYQFEGQLLFVCPPLNGPCLRCLWPEMPEARCVGSCAEVGVLGAVPGIFGCLQAMEALKYLLGLPGPIHDTMVLFNCLDYSSQRVKIPKHPACPVCGSTPTITAIDRDEYYPPDAINVDVSALSDTQLQRYRIIDIREPEEVEVQPLEGVPHDHLPMSRWDPQRIPIDREETCLLSCAHGIRSLRLAEFLRQQGYAKVYSAKDGWQAFHRRRKG
jgi:molybdopterin/thiamine biosynthesis adenylyltransferase/rhodanese-related sulfurtransferase